MENEKKVEKKPTTKIDKKTLIIGGCVLAAIVIVICIVVFGNKSKSNEKELTKNLEKLGGQFYEEFYYPAQEKSQKDVKEFMAKFKDSGIKVNLENISKVSAVDKELVAAMVNSKTKEKCDTKETYVVIKPTDPFGKKNYKVETTLKCGFEDSKKETKTDTKKETKTNTKTTK